MDLNQEFTPGMLSFTDQTDFDYGAFLQADDIMFGGEGAQTQQQVPSDSSDKATPPSTTSGSSSELVARTSAQKQRLERRGHTKSRRGCYNCKRRRIKVFRPEDPSSMDLLTPGSARRLGLRVVTAPRRA